MGDNFNFTPQIKQINSTPYYLCFSIQFFFETNIYVYSNPSIPTLKTKYINFFVGRRYKKMYKTVNMPFYNLKTKMVSSATPINYRKKNIEFKRFLIFYRSIIQNISYEKKTRIYYLKLDKKREFIHKYYPLTKGVISIILAFVIISKRFYMFPCEVTKKIQINLECLKPITQYKITYTHFQFSWLNFYKY